MFFKFLFLFNFLFRFVSFVLFVCSFVLKIFSERCPLIRQKLLCAIALQNRNKIMKKTITRSLFFNGIRKYTPKN